MATKTSKRRKPDRGHVVAGKGEAACGAWVKARGEHCDRPAGWGTDHEGVGVCRLHGGNLAKHVRGRVIANAELSLLVDEPVDIDPSQALLWCVSLAAQDVRWLNDRIAELEEYVIRPRSSEKGVERGEMTSVVKRDPEQLHGYITMRWTAEERLARFSKMALDAGVAERMVRLAEQMGELIAPLIMNILKRLNVADDPQVPKVVREELQRMERGNHLELAA